MATIKTEQTEIFTPEGKEKRRSKRRTKRKTRMKRSEMERIS